MSRIKGKAATNQTTSETVVVGVDVSKNEAAARLDNALEARVINPGG